MKKKLILIIVASILAITGIGLVVFVTSNNSGATAVGLCDNGHKLVNVESKSATCTQYGYSEHTKCLRCDYVEGYVEVAPLGHTEEIIPAIAATCNKTGKSEGKKCSTCGTVLVQQSTLGRLAHSYVTLPAVEPTCTTTGLSEGKICSICGHIGIPQLVVECSPHNEYVVSSAVDPTCTSSGNTLHTRCRDCKSIIQEYKPLPPLGHSSYVTKKAVEATCTKSGLTAETFCAVCGELLTAQTKIEAYGHELKLIPGFEASCLEPGLSDGYTCIRCNTVTQSQVWINALGHNLISMPGMASTCTVKGYSSYERCSNCDYEVGKTELALAKHSFSDSFSYDSDYHFFECVNCKFASTKISHTFSDWTVTVPVSIVVGKEERFCECGFSLFRHIPAIDSDGTVHDLTGCVFRIDEAKLDSINDFSSLSGNYNVTYTALTSSAQRSCDRIVFKPYTNSFSISLYYGTTYLSWLYFFSDKSINNVSGISNFITFTGGADACNPDLICILQTIGCVYSYRITDLTSYNFVLLDRSLFVNEIMPFDFSVTGNVVVGNLVSYSIRRIYSDFVDNKYVIYVESKESGTLQQISYIRGIEITGGADATNESLINMLMKYGYFYPKE